jgi:sRNA-binding carbon storage regulator CsrA
MLKFTRRSGEGIIICTPEYRIEVYVGQTTTRKAGIAIEAYTRDRTEKAPKVTIDRKEIYDAKHGG